MMDKKTKERIEASADYYISLMPTNDKLVLDKIRGHYLNGAIQEAVKSEKLYNHLIELLPLFKGERGRSKKRDEAVRRAKETIKTWFS